MLQIQLNVIKFLRKNSKLILIHSILWTIFYIVDFGFVLMIRGKQTDILSYFSNVVYNTLYFYIVVYFLNKPFNEKQFSILFVKCFIILFIALNFKYFYDVYIFKNVASINNFSKSIYSYFSFELWRLVTINFYAFAFLTYLRTIDDQQKILETERKLMVTEIAFLKAQINPHFLFNTLNFVYQDVCSISPNSGDTIINLADMMRYSVKSTKLDFAPLVSEVEAIDKYIYLQRKRFGTNMYIDFHKIGNFYDCQIPPLILLSLVENAFKYGVYFEKENPIEIILEVTGNQIIFNCNNKIRENYTDTETNAVGLTNIKRRLEISYLNNFDLDNWIENKNYFVHLKINSNPKTTNI